MNIIEFPRPQPGYALIGREMPRGWRRWLYRASQIPHNFRRRYGIWRHFPVLMWRGQPADVTITFVDSGFGGSSAAWRAEEALGALGIECDKGAGHHGRDLEFDWSLKGPVLVTFVGRNRTPEKRRSARYAEPPIDLPTAVLLQ